MVVGGKTIAVGVASLSKHNAVIHNDYGAMTPEQYVPWLEARKARGDLNLGFAQYYINRDTIARIENTYSGAWHTATPHGNMDYIGYEVCESYDEQYTKVSDANFILNENMTLRQVAEDFHYYGLKPNRNTIRLHKEFVSTSCPHRSWKLHGYSINSVKDYFIKQVAFYMSLGKTVQEMIKKENAATAKPTPKPIPSVKPSSGTTHVIIQGDTLWGLSQQYKVSVADLRSWNGLKSDVLQIGKVLKVAKDAPVAAKPKPPVNNTLKGITRTRVATETFYPNDKIHVRSAPNTNAEIVANYSPGEELTYHTEHFGNGYVWVEYVRSSNNKAAFMPVRTFDGKNYGELWGSFEKPKVKKEYIILPQSEKTWRIYPTNVAPVVGNEKGLLTPATFNGGIKYEVLGRPQANIVTVQTGAYGRGNIWAGSPARFVWE